MGAPRFDLESGALDGLPTDGATGAAPLRGAEVGLLAGTAIAPDLGIGVGLSVGGLVTTPPDFGAGIGTLGGAGGDPPAALAGVLAG
jgi:hypothetical protein